MKRRVLKTCIVSALLLMGVLRLYAWEGPFFDLFRIPYSVGAAALGGYHAAYVDGVDTLFSNPAGFRSVEPELSFAQLTLSIYDSAASIIDMVLNGDPAIDELILRRAGFNLMGPLYFGYVGNGLGFGLFNDTTLRYWVWGPYPSGRSMITENLVFISGYAFRIPFPAAWNSTLDIGFSIPVFMAARSDSHLDARGILAAGITLRDFVINEPLITDLGIGIESGILYSVGDVFSLGIVARNLAYITASTYTSMQGFFAGASPSTTSVPLPLDVTVGIMVSPPINRLIHSMDNLRIMVDYYNIFDFLTYEPLATNPFLHIGVGLEVQMLEILRLRAGFYQLLPSVGISIDLTIFELNFAVFGRELSQEPGGYPIWGYLIGLSF